MSSGPLQRFDTPIARVRWVAFVEGMSYLLLLFIAMPLKYWADMPMAVRIVGSLHGALFVALALLTLLAMRACRRGLGWGARIGVASLIPFGTFFIDRGLAEDDEAERARRA
ncbi:MAG: DUF3817 domain-containing protein [Planctomycetes bacterium]|nr:DUF3817 domain-containing protein [Planctomycetota bacterium]